jgi:hypothetical protein
MPLVGAPQSRLGRWGVPLVKRTLAQTAGSMALIKLSFAIAVVLLSTADADLKSSRFNALPKDCRNQTWTIDGGKLEVMSYHIHYK